MRRWRGERNVRSRYCRRCGKRPNPDADPATIEALMASETQSHQAIAKRPTLSPCRSGPLTLANIEHVSPSLKKPRRRLHIRRLSGCSRVHLNAPRSFAAREPSMARWSTDSVTVIIVATAGASPRTITRFSAAPIARIVVCGGLMIAANRPTPYMPRFEMSLVGAAARQPHDRRQVDDRAAPLRIDQPRRLARAQIWRGQIDVQHLPPLRERCLERRRTQHFCRVVHENVEATASLPNRCEQTRYLLGIGQLARQSVRNPPPA